MFKIDEIRGSIPALVTPFKGGAVDEAALRALVDWHIEEGSHGLVPVGTTGESPTLSHDEHKQVVEIVIAQVAGRIPVIAGAGSNNTIEAIDFAKHAETAGADAILVVTPYYNKPTQEGLFEHFKAIHDATNVPIVLYNVPGRSVADITPKTMGRLSKLDRVVAVKDATNELYRVSLQRHECESDFRQITGEDGTALAHSAMGGVGCISVTANVAPRLCAEFQNHLMADNYKAALEIQDRLILLHQAMFCESSPAPAKFALSVLGKCSDEIRLPIVNISSEAETQVREAMAFAGLING